MSDPQSPEEKGNKLLSSWEQEMPIISPKFPVAPDVRPGDAVFLNGETGRYEKAVDGQRPHGIFDGHDVILKNWPFTLRHSPLDGDLTVTDITVFPDPGGDE